MKETEIKPLLTRLCAYDSEQTWFEFKMNMTDPEMIGKYISALANGAMLAGERFAYLIFGIDDKTKQIEGTNVSLGAMKKGNEPISNWLSNRLSPKINFEFYRTWIDGKNVEIVEIEPAYHSPVQFLNNEYIRIHENVRNLKEFPEKARMLWIVTSRYMYEEGICESSKDFNYIKENFHFNELSDFIYNSNLREEMALEQFIADELLIDNKKGTFDITNLFALLSAKNVDNHKTIRGKTIRLITYVDAKGLKAKQDIQGRLGYAIAFKKLMRLIMETLKGSEYFEHGVRKNRYAHPEIAVREFLVNALIHQDLVSTGYGPRVEIFPDKMRITNPGAPLVPVDQFINGPARSRNERLASFMRKGGLCEERGSGVDRACEMIEAEIQSPPLFEVNSDSTIVTLFRNNNFNAMTKEDRIRACYQHACLLRVHNQPLTNSSLRKRLGLSENQSASATGVINDTIEAGLIKPLDVDQAKKNARYVPHWV